MTAGVEHRALGARSQRAFHPLGITCPAAVGNYPESLFAVCALPVDGAGTTCGLADRPWSMPSDPSTRRHMLSGRFYIRQAIETKAFFRVTHRKGGTLFTTTICIHKELNKTLIYGRGCPESGGGTSGPLPRRHDPQAPRRTGAVCRCGMCLRRRWARGKESRCSATGCHADGVAQWERSLPVLA